MVTVLLKVLPGLGQHTIKFGACAWVRLKLSFGLIILQSLNVVFDRGLFKGLLPAFLSTGNEVKAKPDNLLERSL